MCKIIQLKSGPIGDFFSVRSFFEDLMDKKQALGIFWITEEAIEISFEKNFAVNFFHYLATTWTQDAEGRNEFDNVISGGFFNWFNEELNPLPHGVTDYIVTHFDNMRDSFFNLVYDGALSNIFETEFFDSTLLHWPGIHFKIPYVYNPITTNMVLNFANIQLNKFTNQIEIDLSLLIESDINKTSKDAPQINFSNRRLNPPLINEQDKYKLWFKKLTTFLFTSTIRYNKYHRYFAFEENDFANKKLFVQKIIFKFNKIMAFKFPELPFAFLFMENVKEKHIFEEHKYRIRLKILLFNKSTYGEVQTINSTFSWRENLIYLQKAKTPVIDLDNVIIKNLEKFSKSYFQNEKYNTTLTDVFLFLKGKLENLSHYFTLSTTNSLPELNKLLLRNNNFNAAIYYKNKLWGTIAILEKKIIFDFKNMRVMTIINKYHPSYMLDSSEIKRAWQTTLSVLKFYFNDFFNKNDNIFELNNIISTIFAIIVKTKDTSDDSFICTNDFAPHTKVVDLLKEKTSAQKWRIAGVGFNNQFFEPTFDMRMWNYFDNPTIKKPSYKLYDERLWLKRISLKNNLSQLGSWLFERVIAELRLLNYHFVIKSRWENLYLKIKDMDFFVNIFLDGKLIFSLQLYLNYLGNRWRIYPTFDKGLTVFEQINMS